MKQLVYFVAIGEEKYLKQTQEAIYTLRRYGGYKGDIALLTDHALKASTEGIKAYDVRPLIHPRKENVPPHTYAQNCKVLISKVLHLDCYSFVLYLDSDLFVVSPRFTMLLNSMDTIGGMWVQQNYWADVNAKGDIANQGGGRDPALFERCPNLSICSGIVGFGGDAYQYHHLWHQLCTAEDMGTDDQGSLHVVASKFNGGRVNYVPQADVWFPTNLVRNPCIYHFTHQGQEEMAEMRKLLIKP